jgi:hypothetical protein
MFRLFDHPQVRVTNTEKPSLTMDPLLLDNLSHLKTRSVALVREQTTPTEWPPLVGEVSANFLQIECCVVSITDLYGSRFSRPDLLQLLTYFYWAKYDLVGIGFVK